MTEDVYAVLVDRWEALGFGVMVDSFRLTHLIWADNWYTIASSVAMLTRMLKDVTTVMLTRGLYWKENSLEFMTALLNAQNNLMIPFPFPMSNEVAPHPEKVVRVMPLDSFKTKPRMKSLTPSMIGQLKVTSVEQSKQLGVLLDAKGSSATSWMHRKRQAMKTWWTERCLNSSALPRSERLDRFADIMPSTLIYGCEGWSMSNTLMLSIHQCEGNLLRKTARIAKESRENMTEYMRRATRTARLMFCKRGHTPSVIQALQRSFRFAGRVALHQNIQQKIVTAAMNFKTEADWQRVQEMGREDRAHGTWKRRKTNEHWQHRKKDGRSIQRSRMASSKFLDGNGGKLLKMRRSGNLSRPSMWNNCS